MKNPIMILLFVLLPFFILAQSPNKKAGKSPPVSETVTRLPLTVDAWEFQAGKVSFLQHKGVDAVKMDEKSGSMLYRNLNFTNGSIEFDVEVDRPQPFPSLYFRLQNPEETELVYLRTGVAGKKNASDAVQYASIIKGVNLWDVQYEYQSAAEIKVNEWNHVKITVSGKQLKVYVNHQSHPNLEIPCLEGNTSEGKIGIGTGFEGKVIFANITVSQDVEGLSAEPGADITAHDTRYIRNWQISTPDTLEYGREPGVFMLPKTDTVWEKIEAERRGFVNLSRKLGSTNFRRFIWLRATVKSEFNQPVMMADLFLYLYFP